MSMDMDHKGPSSVKDCASPLLSSVRVSSSIPCKLQFNLCCSIHHCKTMISILAQERLLGAAMGSAFVGFVVFEQRKCIYGSISDDRNQLDTQSQLREPIFGNQFRSQFELLWNKAVDETFGPVVDSLNSRRQ